MVACFTFSPRLRISVWRRISYSRARCTLLKELRFLISTLVPKGSPTRRTETLTSARSLPSSGEASEIPRVWTRAWMR